MAPCSLGDPDEVLRAGGRAQLLPALTGARQQPRLLASASSLPLLVSCPGAQAGLATSCLWSLEQTSAPLQN